MSSSVHETFWNARYSAAGEDYLFGIAPARFVETHAHYFCGGSTVLSIADGEGRNSVWLAQQGLQVTALEISPLALHKARKLANACQIEVDFIQADVLTMTWPSALYDFVLAVFVQFAGPQERQQMFAGLKQAVKPGGLMLLHGYTPLQLEFATGGPSAVENLYTAAMLKDTFVDFEILELREYIAELTEGQAHNGRSALIDLVARRRF